MELGISVQRHQVFCFQCNVMWAHRYDQYPSGCAMCGASYTEPRMYAMPDLVIEDQETSSRAIIFVNGIHHDKERTKKKDQYQIDIFKKNGWRVFTIWNEEMDLMRHANRCFLVLGIYTAMKNPSLYIKAFAREKELLH